jgi:putative restriction endonuclease
VVAQVDELAFRESVFAWLRARLLTTEGLTRDELSAFPFQGRVHRLVGPMTGIWRVKELSEAAISIVTAYVPEGSRRPYDDGVGADGLLRYKWRGADPGTADNRWLRTAMGRELPLVWFIGVGYRPGSRTQVFRPEFPVWLIGEEPHHQQFVVSVEEGQQRIPDGASAEVIDITRRYNERVVQARHHQPLFRAAVLLAYERRCSVCRLPFAELLDAAHIKADADGGAARVTNGLALCKIHHAAFDANLIGISPIKEMDGERLRQLPRSRSERPDRDLLAERFSHFADAS